MPKVLVERFVGVWPGETCERATDKASLTNTYWKVLRLGETEVRRARVSASRTSSCARANRVSPPRSAATRSSAATGWTSDRLTFAPGPTTRMACPDPLGAWEGQLVQTLEQAANWRIDGQTLELLDGEGNPLALLQAVYLY